MTVRAETAVAPFVGTKRVVSSTFNAPFLRSLRPVALSVHTSRTLPAFFTRSVPEHTTVPARTPRLAPATTPLVLAVPGPLAVNSTATPLATTFGLAVRRVAITVTAADAADASDSDDGLAERATAVNVYAVPAVSPVTVHDPLAPETTQLAPPGLAVTTKDDTAGPVAAA